MFRLQTSTGASQANLTVMAASKVSWYFSYMTGDLSRGAANLFARTRPLEARHAMPLALALDWWFPPNQDVRCQCAQVRVLDSA